MARRSATPTPAAPKPAPTVPTPLPDTGAPLPTTLLTGPRVFARQLQATEPRWWRYVGVVVLSSVLSGVAYALLVRHVPGSGSLTGIVNVLGGIFLGLLGFLLMWGLGRLGAGKAGRAAEVYGATFALLPPLWLLVIVWTLLTPAAVWLPQGTLPADELQRATLRAAAGTQAAFLLILVSLLGTVAQIGLALPALGTLTGQPGRALLGGLLPLLPVLAVQFVVVAPLLIALLSRPPGG